MGECSVAKQGRMMLDQYVTVLAAPRANYNSAVVKYDCIFFLLLGLVIGCDSSTRVNLSA